MPPPDSDPEEVKRWWHSLTPGQQDRVKQWFPNTLRNRDGIPIAVRNELNLSVLQRELTRLQNGWLSRDGVWHTDTDKLADLRALRDTLAAHPGTSLILLDTASDPRKVLAAVGVGDVDNAERVGVTMGGLNTRVSSSVGDMVKEAGIQRAKAAELRERAGWPNYDAVASIAWLGYDAPDGLKDVMHDWSASRCRGAVEPLRQRLGRYHECQRSAHHRVRAFLRIPGNQSGAAAGGTGQRRRFVRFTGHRAHARVAAGR